MVTNKEFHELLSSFIGNAGSLDGEKFNFRTLSEDKFQLDVDNGKLKLISQRTSVQDVEYYIPSLSYVNSFDKETLVSVSFPPDNLGGGASIMFSGIQAKVDKAIFNDLIEGSFRLMQNLKEEKNVNFDLNDGEVKNFSGHRINIPSLIVREVTPGKIVGSAAVNQDHLNEGTPDKCCVIL